MRVIYTPPVGGDPTAVARSGVASGAEGAALDVNECTRRVRGGRRRTRETNMKSQCDANEL